VQFSREIPWAGLTTGLASTDPAIQRAARAQLRLAIAEQGAALATELRRLGVTQLSRAGDSLPVMFGRASRAVIEELAQHAKVSLVTSADPGRRDPHTAADVPANGVTNPDIDGGFNALGYYGKGQKLALVEGGNDAIWEPHEALDFVELDEDTGERVTYMVEPQDCELDETATNGSNCPDIDQACLELGHPGHPRQCVARHASQCLSIAVGSGGGQQYGASQAQIYYPNDGADPYSPLQVGPTVACSPAATAGAYDWLEKHDVTTVNESFGCIELGAGAAEGITQDYYARHFDMAIFKSAGNQKSGRTEPACAFTLNSNCVGGVNKYGEMSCFSSWTNLNGPGLTRTDREEPDIVALAGDGTGPKCGTSMADQMTFMTVGKEVQWSTSSAGTSYAAPAMAGFTALLKEACGGKLNHNVVRAILRNAGFRRNAKDYAYSTPVVPASADHDWKDGGGALTAKDAIAFCQPGSGSGPGNASGTDEGCLDCGEPAPFKNDCPTCGPIPPGSSRPLSASPFGPGDARLYTTYWNNNGKRLTKGMRVRTTVAWDSCPGGPTGTAPAAVATDIDVVLVNLSSSTPVYASQSVTDSVEGFDVIVPSTGKYALMWTNPEGAKGCEQAGHEPLAWAVTWGDF
jgi:hypothetical protein